ncbi:hydroxyacid dehydrogenase [Catellatospora bangladeshensis]|uniref:Glycerate dehydrogenase n=1 Tax=Catellatospora bangladeshensis TaxID=310355 RepID=A0A8J3NLK7_9ACTN|nr:hydroxyacid dehydrogenase [Catellatospora bangladeshensis]GIF84056.1 glycerate dehydrogenase [Catellatospora bangladeshensis]
MSQPDRPAGLVVMSPSAATVVLPDDLMARLAAALRLAAPGVVAGFGGCAGLSEVEVLVTGWGCPELTGPLLDSMPRLRAVIHAAGSVKHHIGPEVFARGIAVSSAADANADPVVDFTLAVLQLAGKRAFAHARRYAEGRATTFSVGERSGNDGRTVGVVGASRIGRKVITRLRAAGFRALVSDPYLAAADALALGAEPAGLDDLCRRSDVLTLHAPELPETRHLIDERRLALLPDGAIVINTARGSLIDTEALVRACAGGRIDAVLDVTAPEPLPAGHPLFALPNVWITPHLAGVQGTEVRRLGEYAVAEVERLLSGTPLAGTVHAHQLPVLA